MARDPKKNPPVRCIPPEQWLGSATSSSRPLQEVWAEQLTAHIAGGKRALRDMATYVTKRYWEGCCAYCGSSLGTDWTWEHFEPRSHGGDDSAANCIAACRSCNSKRGSSDPWEFMRSIGRDEIRIRHVQAKVSRWQEISRLSNSAGGIDHVSRGFAILDRVGVFTNAESRYGFLPEEIQERRSRAAPQRTDPFA